MGRTSNTIVGTRSRALKALRDAFLQQKPGITVDDRGYVPDFRDTLLSTALPEDFEDDLRAGDGNELLTKFRAIHSSSGLGVNCFAPFRTHLQDLHFDKDAAFAALQFERRCPTGLRGGRFPNLDILASGPGRVVGIESKLTEYLVRHHAKFSPAYADQIRDERRGQGYFEEMQRLVREPDSYVWLDAAQLIKHAFGLAHTFRNRPTTLLYLFWEPANPDASPAFSAHRAEIDAFSRRVAGSTPDFIAMSYPELWALWRQTAPVWLLAHLDELKARYLIKI